MSALWPRINVSLQAVAQILLVIGLGVWLSKRRNLDRQALAAVSNVNWHALIPALMVSLASPIYSYTSTAVSVNLHCKTQTAPSS